MKTMIRQFILISSVVCLLVIVPFGKAYAETDITPILKLLLLDDEQEVAAISQCQSGLLADLNGPNSSGSFRVNPQFTNLNGKTLFFADHPDSGTEIWVTDGTSSGTHILKDIHSGAGDGIAGGSLLTDRQMIRVGNEVFFIANDGLGFELWKTDASTAGTTMVKDIDIGSGSPGISNLTGLQ